jgi:hypothetical protein
VSSALSIVAMPSPDIVHQTTEIAETDPPAGGGRRLVYHIGGL